MELAVTKKARTVKSAGKLPLMLSMLTLLPAVIAYTFLVLNHDPSLVKLTERLLPMSLEHPLGTDHLGRDVLTRLAARLTADGWLRSLSTVNCCYHRCAVRCIGWL